MRQPVLITSFTSGSFYNRGDFMTIQNVALRKLGVGLAVLAMTGLAGCVAPGGKGDFHQLPGGSFENTGAIIEDPGVFRIVGGQPYTTPFAIDCTKLSADAGGWQDALKAGAHKVSISLPGYRTYGGVLAFCLIHKSATGPSSRSYQVVIPAGKIPEASDGLVASVAEQVSVQRYAAVDFGAMLMAPPDQTPQATAITDDFAWMLWFTDRPDVMGISFVASAPPTQAPAATHNETPMPKLVKGASYTLTKGLNLRAGPGSGQAVVAALKAGDSVVASGDEKAGYWAVTTVGGQSGWVGARSLKPN